VTPGVKRFKAMPSSARRAKKSKRDEQSQMLEVLQNMQRKEEEFMKKQETRDAQFLNIMGDVSKAIQKIADGHNGPQEGSSQTQLQYYIVENND
jgi:membrane protein involved in colicin uptake